MPCTTSDWAVEDHAKEYCCQRQQETHSLVAGLPVIEKKNTSVPKRMQWRGSTQARHEHEGMGLGVSMWYCATHVASAS